MMYLPVVVIDFLKLENLNSGLGQFCFHLGKALVEQNNQRFQLHFLVPPQFDGVFGSQAQYFFSADSSALPANISLLHRPHQESNCKIKAAKIVMTIHDLNFLYKYGWFKKTLKLLALKKRVKRTNALAFISNFSRQDFLKHLQYPMQSTKVIHNGLCLPLPSKRPESGVPRNPFFFSLGVISAKKNFEVLIPFMKYFPEMDLVIAGNKSSDYAKSIIKLVKSLSLENRVYFPGEISEPAKSWFYEHCSAFLFPSISEGFGLPLIEAFYFGKPAFCSNLTSLPEIGGSLAHYWNSFDEQSMAKVVREGLKNWNPEKAELVKQQSLVFSWNKAADSYLQLYEDVLR